MYYFLDVDGVLNKERDWRKPFTVNSVCVNNLKKLLCTDKDTHVVLSSTWRQGGSNTGIKSKSIWDSSTNSKEDCMAIY